MLNWGQVNFSRVRTLSAAKARAIQIAQGPDAPLVLFVAAYAAELAVYTSVDPLIDRYLYPMVPAAAILLLRRPAQPSRIGRSRVFARAAFVWRTCCVPIGVLRRLPFMGEGEFLR